MTLCDHYMVMSQYYSYLHCISARTGHMSKPHRGTSASMGLVLRRGFRWCKGHFASAGTGCSVTAPGAQCQHRRFHTTQCPHWALFFHPVQARGEICPVSVLGLFLSQCLHWDGAMTGATGGCHEVYPPSPPQGGYSFLARLSS